MLQWNISKSHRLTTIKVQGQYDKEYDSGNEFEKWDGSYTESIQSGLTDWVNGSESSSQTRNGSSCGKVLWV